jgi:toxin ParE1/3/4
MDHSIEIRPLATLETIDAYNWYESQRDGLGLEFLASLDSFYDNLLLNPYTHSFYVDSVRQGVLNKFPYTVVYEVHENLIIIYSVFMDKQNPVKKRTK